jgi:hypothetical protein
MKKSCAGSLSALALFALTGAAWANPNAATGYFENFNASSIGWDGIQGSPNAATYRDTESDGNGYMRSVVKTSALPASFDASVFSSQPSLAGNYGGYDWTVSADLKLIQGNFDNVWLRFRYQDPSFNGWTNQLTSNFAQSGWFGVSETFNALWTDAEARTHGWRPDDEVLGGSAPMSWAQTMSNVYTVELRFSGSGTPIAPHGNFIQAGVDNFSLTAVQQAAPIPEPETYAMMLAGLGLLGLVRRRKQKLPA